MPHAHASGFPSPGTARGGQAPALRFPSPSVVRDRPSPNGQDLAILTYRARLPVCAVSNRAYRRRDLPRLDAMLPPASRYRFVIGLPSHAQYRVFLPTKSSNVIQQFKKTIFFHKKMHFSQFCATEFAFKTSYLVKKRTHGRPF